MWTRSDSGALTLAKTNARVGEATVADIGYVRVLGCWINDHEQTVGLLHFHEAAVTDRADQAVQGNAMKAGPEAA